MVVSSHVTFRADSSHQIGIGHVMRCLTLARRLRERGAECHFISRELPGHISTMILDAGFELSLLPPPDGPPPDGPPAHAFLAGVDWQQDAQETLAILEKSPPDWLVVDHYAFDERWEDAARPNNTRLMAVDDLADRKHSADLLLDQNLGRLASDYDDFLPNHATRLIGPKFALLRPEFALARPASLVRRATPALRHIMISMGGTDSQNATGQVLDVLAKSDLPKNTAITVVMGSSAPFLGLIQERAASMPLATTVRVDVEDMAGLMIDTDLAIGGAGSTSWERCCLGVPSLMLVLADNQDAGGKALENVGAAVVLGAIGGDIWQRRLSDFLSERDILWRIECMSKKASKVSDGNGCHVAIEEIFGWKAR